MAATEKLILDALSTRKPEGIEIIPSPKPSRTIEYDEIGGGRRSRKKLPKDVEKWNTGNFVSYARRLYLKRYGRDWSLNYPSACLEILKVKDTLVELLGGCDNKTFYRFIGWFFDNHIDSCVNRSQAFYIRHMQQDWIVDLFCKEIKVAEKSVKPQQPEAQNDILNESHINAIYLLSEDRLVLEYGVVIAVNWLLKQGLSPKDSAYTVFQVLVRLKRQDRLQEALTSTSKFNPYPSNLRFNDAQWLFRKVDPAINISVQINDEKSNAFVRSLGD